MRHLVPALCSLISLVFLVAGAGCGPAGADDDGSDDGGGRVELGAACDPRVMTGCSADLPICVALDDTATEGFCSKSCATTPEPDSGDEPPLPAPETAEICGDGYTGEATAACAVRFEPENGTILWACGLACGRAGESDFGTCPSNLFCNQPNPDQNGFCLP